MDSGDALVVHRRRYLFAVPQANNECGHQTGRDAAGPAWRQQRLHRLAPRHLALGHDARRHGFGRWRSERRPVHLCGGSQDGLAQSRRRRQAVVWRVAQCGAQVLVERHLVARSLRGRHGPALR
jgi:hypothetical protein